jgi:hypothetical protein
MSEDQKRQLETQLWGLANLLRDKISADDYRDYILGSKKMRTVKFQTNNDTNKINFLPNLPELIVTSFFMDDWSIKGMEMEMLIKNKKTISGKIKNGRIEI